MRRYAVATVVAALALLTLGCAGGDDDDALPTGPPDTSEMSRADRDITLRTAIYDYVAAFAAGDADAATDFLSARCTEEVPIADFHASVAAAGELYPDLRVEKITDVVLDGDNGVVFYTTDPDVEEGDGERWVRQRGAWRWDDC